MFKGNEVLPKLLSIALFEGFDGNNENDRCILKIFYDNVIIRMCKAGEVIIHEGDIGDEFYILRSGSVHIYRELLLSASFCFICIWHALTAGIVFLSFQNQHVMNLLSFQLKIHF